MGFPCIIRITCIEELRLLVPLLLLASAAVDDDGWLPLFASWELDGARYFRGT